MDKPLAQMSNAELQAKLAQMQAELEHAKQANNVALRLRIGPKGTVVLTGVASKYGAAFYADTWLQILDHGDKIRQFIKENDAKVAKKGVPYTPPAASKA